ncbi:uncharacterized protein K452DRAFT_63161 [Aplosporella prunicola CBS 121167]|uniref:Uncharacterized protein n=1 Tax=Aplosporella prunicola CBS 121167 TaxID=1176127 RepID=A0A6A6B7U0_9PEZI|nr:uncharacterized protein K452DRAFT_63161 [Aplosporella prunicola CBS 121167]KAF2139628.1 hypothetical protein K452DRAFT_63161 [Aplosporella prunicola CBS 121167]
MPPPSHRIASQMGYVLAGAAGARQIDRQAGHAPTTTKDPLLPDRCMQWTRRAWLAAVVRISRASAVCHGSLSFAIAARLGVCAGAASPTPLLLLWCPIRRQTRALTSLSLRRRTHARLTICSTCRRAIPTTTATTWDAPSPPRSLPLNGVLAFLLHAGPASGAVLKNGAYLGRPCRFCLLACPATKSVFGSPSRLAPRSLARSLSFPGPGPRADAGDQGRTRAHLAPRSNQRLAARIPGVPFQ